MPLSEAGRRELERLRAQQAREAEQRDAPAPASPGEGEFGRFTPPTDVPPRAPDAPEEEDGGNFLTRGFRAVMENPVVQATVSGEKFLNAVLPGDPGTAIGEKLDDIPLVGGAVRMGFDALSSPLTLATAGGGGAAAAGLRGFGAAAARQGTIRGFGARAAANVIEPVAAGSFGQRLAAETLLETGAGLGFQAAEERLPEDMPGALRFGLSLGAGLVGGTGALRAGRRIPGGTRVLSTGHMIDETAVVEQTDLDDLAGVQRVVEDAESTVEGRRERGRNVRHVVPNRSVDEVMQTASWRERLALKYQNADGWMSRIARTVLPDDPTAHALMGEMVTREQAHRGWVSAQIERLRPAMEAFDINKEGRVTNVAFENGEYRFTPEQEAALTELRALLDENLAWMKENGIEVEEITGRQLADDVEKAKVLPLDQPMFGDLVERFAGVPGGYFPRIVTEIDGIGRLKGRIDPRRQRTPGFDETPGGEHLALMEENIANGIKYEGDWARIVHDSLVATGDKVNARWLQTAAERFGKSANDYIDEQAPGLRMKSQQLAAQVRRKRESLIRTVARQTARKRAKTAARRSELRLRAQARKLTVAENRELEALEHLENLHGHLASLPDGMQGTPRARAAARRSAEAAQGRVQDAVERTDAVRQTLDEGMDILRMAEDAEIVVGQQRAVLEAELAGLRESLDNVRSDLDYWRKRSSAPRPNESFVPQIGGSRSFPREFARTLNRGLNAQPTRLQEQVNSFNRVARMTMATMDLSFAGIQGLLSMATHPLGAARALAIGSASLFGRAGDRMYMNWVRQHADSIADFLEHSGHWAAEDMAGEFVLGAQSRVGRLGPVRRTNMAFSRTGNLFRLMMWENAIENASLMQRFSARGKATGLTRAQRRKVATGINSMTGFKNGRVTSWEETMLFAPRFFRSQLDTIARAFKSGADADMARVALFRTMLLGSLFTIMVNNARGRETDFSPFRERADGSWVYNSNFMRIRDVGGQDVSVFGTWDSLLGLMATTVSAGPLEGAERLLRTKASPIVGTVWDIAQGETFTGQPVDIKTPQGLAQALATETMNKLPFTIQDGLAGADFAAAKNSLLDGEIGAAAGELVSEESLAGMFNFFGGKSSPITAFEQQDMLAMDMFGRHWADLTGQEQKAVREARPEVVDEAAQRDQERAARGDIDAKARVAKREIDDQRQAAEVGLMRMLEAERLTLRDFREEIEKVQTAAANRREGIEIMLDREYRDSDNPNVQALSGWYDLYDLAKWPDTDVIDWDLLGDLQREFQRGLTSEQQRFVDERTRAEHSPLLDWYFDAKEYISLSGYFDTVDAAFQSAADDVQAVDPSLTSYGRLLAAIDAARASGDVGREEVLKEYSRDVERQSRRYKELLRAQDPFLEDALLATGRITKRTETTRDPFAGFDGGLGDGFEGLGGGFE